MGERWCVLTGRRWERVRDRYLGTTSRLCGVLAQRSATASHLILSGVVAAAIHVSMAPEQAVAQTVIPPSAGPCIVAGTTATCTGNLSAGIDADGPTIDTLNINSLTQNLGNTGAASAINFTSPNGNITVNLNTGIFEAIAATGGALTNVVDATVIGAGNVTVNSTGNLTNNALSNGIIGFVGGNGNVTIVSEGNIAARSIGINAVVADAGDVLVQSTGNVTINAPIPVFPAPPTRPAAIRAAVTNAGNVRIVSTGDISITGGTISSGIQANEFLGLVTARTVTIVSTGNISASGATNSFGIQAGHDIGPIDITSMGNINAAIGISALLGTSGDVRIVTTGNINGTDEGILTSNPAGTSFVSIAGTVTGGGGTAINMTANPGVAELALNAGWALSGQARTVTTDADDILSLRGAADSSLDLSQVGDAANPNGIIGFDILNKQDGATWTLTGTQTAGALTATNVNGGVLANNGTLLAPVFVNNAVYGGTGTSNALTVNAGGTAQPALGTIGTLNVNGNLTFNAGSIYQVNLDETGASDRIAATGPAAISTNGTSIDIVSDPTATFPDVSPIYTVIAAAGGVTGQFATIADNLPDLAFSATYTANTVDLSYVRAGTTGTSNVSGVPDFSPKEIHPSALAAGIYSDWLFVDTLSRRVGFTLPETEGSDLAGQALGFAAQPDGTQSNPRGNGVWGALMAEHTRIGNSASVTGWDATIGGVAFGIERRLDTGRLGISWPPVLVGLAGGYTKTDVTSGASGADVESFHAGIYAAARHGALTVSGAVAAAHQSYEISRVIDLGGGAAMTASGDPNGFSVTSSFESTYDFNAAFGLFDGIRTIPGNLGFGPVVSVDVLHGKLDGFTETNAGLLNLTVDDTSGTQVITGLGFAVDWKRSLGNREFSLEGRVAWEYVFGDQSLVTQSAIAAVAGANFSTASAAVGRNRLTLGAGGALALSDRLAAHARYDGRFSTRSTDHRGSAGLTFRF
ncbi:MAG: autotransporter domain-containing protein [Pseudomonadota bacterium]